MFFKFHFMCSPSNSQYHMMHIAAVPQQIPSKKQKSRKPQQNHSNPQHNLKKQAQPPLRLLTPGLPET
jgi:hypothetical protein